MKHTISILCNDTPGVLNRISSLFSRRGLLKLFIRPVFGPYILTIKRLLSTIVLINIEPSVSFLNLRSKRPSAILASLPVG